MIHPLADSFSELSDNEIEQKILKLNSIYFMATDESVRHQIILLLDSLKIEIEDRRIAKKLNNTDNSELDNLINVS